MKTILQPLQIGAIAILAMTSVAQAQSFSISWHTINGGGGTSTGGVYSVSGTIGQTDVRAMSGGGFTLKGGFWSFVSAVQTPDAPLLSITLTPTNTAVVSWPAPSTGFVLQQNTNGLSSLQWSNVSAGIQDNGSSQFLIVNPTVGNRFYRLAKP